MNLVTVRPAQDGVVWVELDDGDANGLSNAMIDGLVQALRGVGADSSARVAVLAGNSRWFCSGATRDTLQAVVEHRLAPAELTLGMVVAQAPVPVIAAAEGDTLGGGLALLLACDLRVLASQSRHCANFMTLGITPGMGITHLLSDAVGTAMAHELLYTGRTVRAGELPAGCVNAVVDRARVRTTAEALAWSVACNARDNLRLLKSSLALARREALQRAFHLEALMHESSLTRFDERQMA